MANPPPNNLNANLPKDEPIKEDDEEEVEAEEDDEEEMKAREDEEMKVKESKIRGQLPLKKRYRETPYDPFTDTTPRPRPDDPYAMARDAAVIVPTREDDENPAPLKLREKELEVQDLLKDMLKAQSQLLLPGLEVTSEKSWTDMKTMMTEEFCPSEAIQRMEEKKKTAAYIRGLSDNIKGEVTSSEPTTLSAAVCMANTLME
nr:hypothetical protein [Tanacetum cinerariifolium]